MRPTARKEEEHAVTEPQALFSIFCQIHPSGVVEGDKNPTTRKRLSEEKKGLVGETYFLDRTNNSLPSHSGNRRIFTRPSRIGVHVIDRTPTPRTCSLARHKIVTNPHGQLAP